jgi:hypothetical protein
MWLFSAMLIGIVGTILIECLHHKPESETMRVPVRVYNDKPNRSYRK